MLLILDLYETGQCIVALHTNTLKTATFPPVIFNMTDNTDMAMYQSLNRYREELDEEDEVVSSGEEEGDENNDEMMSDKKRKLLEKTFVLQNGSRMSGKPTELNFENLQFSACFELPESGRHPAPWIYTNLRQFGVEQADIDIDYREFTDIGEILPTAGSDSPANADVFIKGTFIVDLHDKIKTLKDAGQLRYVGEKDYAEIFETDSLTTHGSLLTFCHFFK